MGIDAINCPPEKLSSPGCPGGMESCHGVLPDRSCHSLFLCGLFCFFGGPTEVFPGGVMTFINKAFLLYTRQNECASLVVLDQGIQTFFPRTFNHSLIISKPFVAPMIQVFHPSLQILAAHTDSIFIQSITYSRGFRLSPRHHDALALLQAGVHRRAARDRYSGVRCARTPDVCASHNAMRSADFRSDRGPG